MYFALINWVSFGGLSAHACMPATPQRVASQILEAIRVYAALFEEAERQEREVHGVLDPNEANEARRGLLRCEQYEQQLEEERLLRREELEIQRFEGRFLMDAAPA